MNPAIIIAAVLGFLFLTKKKATGQNPSEGDNVPNSGGNYPNRPITTGMINDAFQDCIDIYGAEMSRKVEKVFRLESAHFTSGQFRKTYSAGMTAVKDKPFFPFGWSSLATWVNLNPELAQPSDFYLVPMSDAGNPVKFIGFPNLESSVLFTAYMIEKRGGNPATWHSTDLARQQEYNRRLSSISTTTTDDLMS